MPFLAYVLVLSEDVLTEQPVESITAYIGENKVLLDKTSPCGVRVCVCVYALYKHDCVQVCDRKRVWRPECQCQMLLYHSFLYFFEVNSLSETRV